LFAEKDAALIRKPGQEQFETRLRTQNGEQREVVISRATFCGADGRTAGLVGVVTDITQVKEAENRLKQSYEQLRRTLNAAVQAIVAAVETRDPYTAGHQKRVTRLSRAIAQEMGLDSEITEGIRVAASIHDIGKISVPAEILSKPTKLSEIEFGLIQTHSMAGYEILRGIDFPWPVAQMVLQHHERQNGSGYPAGLRGEEIMPEARIITVADVVEAMATHRPYRPARGLEAALAEIEKNKGILYDAAVVDVCLRLFREKGFEF
ncbi:MAG: HD domain-containing protein, partial [Smithellaceae bacterium]|nr:HD domain-containing protein [Smithellaceae bacterium]